MSRSGWTVYATARKPETLAAWRRAGAARSRSTSRRGLHVHGRETVLGDAGRIDALVNNAGYSQSGAVETLAARRRTRAQFETNVFGPSGSCQLVLPSMRRSGSGRIVNVSSMGGRLVFPGGGAYNATSTPSKP